MKVRITKVSWPTLWYCDKIGMEFQVTDWHKDFYLVVGGQFHNRIRKCDCVVSNIDVNLNEIIWN